MPNDSAEGKRTIALYLLVVGVVLLFRLLIRFLRSAAVETFGNGLTCNVRDPRLACVRNVRSVSFESWWLVALVSWDLGPMN